MGPSLESYRDMGPVTEKNMKLIKIKDKNRLLLIRPDSIESMAGTPEGIVRHITTYSHDYSVHLDEKQSNALIHNWTTAIGAVLPDSP